MLYKTLALGLMCGTATAFVAPTMGTSVVPHVATSAVTESRLGESMMQFGGGRSSKVLLPAQAAALEGELPLAVDTKPDLPLRQVRCASHRVAVLPLHR